MEATPAYFEEPNPLFLRSKGRVKEAEEIQSLNDAYVGYEFANKEWLLHNVPGPYDDYQRLYVGPICTNHQLGEAISQYTEYYCTHASDLAFLQLFDNLRSFITWDVSLSDSQKNS